MELWQAVVAGALGFFAGLVIASLLAANTVSELNNRIAELNRRIIHLSSR